MTINSTDKTAIPVSSYMLQHTANKYSSQIVCSTAICGTVEPGRPGES